MMTARDRALAILSRDATLDAYDREAELLAGDEESLRELRAARTTAEAHVQLAVAVALKRSPWAT